MVQHIFRLLEIGMERDRKVRIGLGSGSPLKIRACFRWGMVHEWLNTMKYWGKNYCRTYCKPFFRGHCLADFTRYWLSSMVCLSSKQRPDWNTAPSKTPTSSILTMFSTKVFRYGVKTGLVRPKVSGSPEILTRYANCHWLFAKMRLLES